MLNGCRAARRAGARRDRRDRAAAASDGWLSSDCRPRRRPAAAAAVVIALAISQVLVKGIQNESAFPGHPAAPASPAVEAGPGGVPRYYVALGKSNRIVAGDSVTGKLLATLAVPVREGFTNIFMGTTAAADRTFAVTVRELSVSGPATGGLLTDGKIVWKAPHQQVPRFLLAACTNSPAQLGTQYHLISADGTTFGCPAITGPGTDPNLSFLTYPLAAGVAVIATPRIDYQITNMTKRGVSQQQILWISPSGDAVVGAWTTCAKGTLADAPNGLHVGVMSHGKFTPLRFPPGVAAKFRRNGLGRRLHDALLDGVTHKALLSTADDQADPAVPVPQQRLAQARAAETRYPGNGAVSAQIACAHAAGAAYPPVSACP